VRSDYGHLLTPALYQAFLLALSRRLIVCSAVPVISAMSSGTSRRISTDLLTASLTAGPSPRDLTPEAMRRVITKELPGFGELMRKVSLEQVPTAILSRQTAGIRGRSLIVNLPGRPSSIEVCLEAFFPTVPYCLELIGAGKITTDPAMLRCYRPEQPIQGASSRQA